MLYFLKNICATLFVVMMIVPSISVADEIHRLEKSIALLKQKILLEKEKNSLLSEQQTKLTKTLAITKLNKDIRVEQLTLPQFKIVVNTAQIASRANPDAQCNAKAFVEFTCNGKVECEFTIDKTICGEVSAETDEKEMVANYACGTQQRTHYLKFGLKGMLSCK